MGCYTAIGMSTDAFRLNYLARTAAGVPRDLANTLVVSKLKTIRPTVLIYNCTFVCDARDDTHPAWVQRLLTFDTTSVLKDDDFYVLDDHMNAKGHEAVGAGLAAVVQKALAR